MHILALNLRLPLPPPLCLSVSLSLCLFSLTAGALAQDDTEEQESPYHPGLVARYVAAGGQALARVDETIAFDWRDAPPDTRLPQGTFKATWSGRLWTQVAGQHRLAIIVGGGKFALQLAGREIVAGAAAEPQWFVSEPIDLEFDRHPLELTFEKTGQQARIGLFWSGPGFGLEPVPERFLMHDRDESPSTDFERGQRLAAALRCGACHAGQQNREPLLAPALDKLAGNVYAAWLVDWLSKAPEAASNSRIVRRMPHFALNREEAADVAAWLVRLPAANSGDKASQEIEQKETKAAKKGKGKAAPSKPSAEEGERLFLTLGCLACHQHGELGESGLFGGGDLTGIARKRPPEFFARWLADPGSLNRQHRMPVFDLTSDEQQSLATWLASGAKSAPAEITGDSVAGEKLVTRLQCASCHALPGVEASPKSAGVKPLAASSDWSQSCAGEVEGKAARPGYRLTPADQSALKAYYSSSQGTQPASPQAFGRDVLVELNCLACHAREGIDRTINSLPARLQDKLAAVVAIHDEFGKLVPAMTPPALNSVGDKLHDAALADAIERKGPPHRSYLQVRMPKFNLSETQLAALTAYFAVTDRIPRGAGVSPVNHMAGETPNPRLAAAGPRLVTTDGFGCTSCHQVGSVLPDKAPLNARGPALSMLDKRIRREWFNRWCNNPARIVPRMEMPSVQIPVRGVLNEKIDDQLAAVWHILNTPGFEPPEPNPVRVLRLSGIPERKEQPIVLHDVIKAGDKTYLFPLVIGLPNRQNILFDLETNRLAAWWLGDTARQRTKGKSWYWEQGEKAIFDSGLSSSELTLLVSGKELQPRLTSQFAARMDHFIRVGSEALVFSRSMEFDLSAGTAKKVVTLKVIEVIRQSTNPSINRQSFVREIGVVGIPADMQVRFRFLSTDRFRQGKFNQNNQTLSLPGIGDRTFRFGLPPETTLNEDGSFDLMILATSAEFSSKKFGIEYQTDLSADQFVLDALPSVSTVSTEIEIAPGFIARRAPLDDSIMPTGFAWKPDGRLVVASLKGQVYLAHDADGDDLPDNLRLLADGLATPYGVAAGKNFIDVITKTGLWRHVEVDESGIADHAHLLTSGWGVTDDYHDWAVGLLAGEKGEYYIGLPCQQDHRSEAAAKHRGQLLKLVPREATPEHPRLFDIEVLSSGHRFPMGLARNREGELFVTDNQGNYNPFNELNHVRPGAHFGFINANEKERGYKPPRLDKPAIDIPHPWTRSVNGICFLDTPKTLREKTGKDAFGPLEGHLIGCEYDTRQLIRMTLQKVGDTYQGAAYPLSIPPDNVEDGLLGPIVCAVSPRGELYVGNIRDSGWGAGNNVGDIVQIKIEPEKLPCGIAEVRATTDGFTLDFFRPVERAKAADPANYSLASYRRESTPAYGGPNLDRRIEKLAGVEVAPDGKRVTLKLADLREGFVYEFQLKPLVRGKEPFHPAEAHYTLNRIP